MIDWLLGFISGLVIFPSFLFISALRKKGGPEKRGRGRPKKVETPPEIPQKVKPIKEHVADWEKT